MSNIKNKSSRKRELLFIDEHQNNLNSLEASVVSSQSVKAINIVYETSNYSMFAKVDGNRIIDKTATDISRIRKIAESIKEIGQFAPIVVEWDSQINKFVILDGQTRFEAQISEQSSIKFFIVDYIGDDSVRIDSIRSVNKHQKNWIPKDTGHSFSRCNKHGNQLAYIKYKEFLDMGLSHSVILRMVSEFGDEKSVKNKFYEGLLPLNDAVYDKIKSLLKMFENSAMPTKVWNKEYFWRAWFSIRKANVGFSAYRFFQQYKKYSNLFGDNYYETDNLNAIIRVYNHNSKSKKARLNYNEICFKLSDK
tara:strand:+ start:1282 stop:2202 length:921 start_codon:yes stop_codon:yes gene_type:complete